MDNFVTVRVDDDRGNYMAEQLGIAQVGYPNIAVYDDGAMRNLSAIVADMEKAMAGLENVNLPGRIQVVSEEPHIIVDGAHNAASIDALMRAIGQHIPYDSMIVIFGCQKDKDISGMIRRVQIGADKIIFTSTGSPRSADPKELAALFSEHSGRMTQVAEKLEDAMQIATSAITREDVICVTGSFYLVAEALRKYSSITS